MRSSSECLRYYAAARSYLGGDKTFHVKMAGLLRSDDPDLAIRVLTDLAESEADNAAVMRLVPRPRATSERCHPSAMRARLANGGGR